MYSLVFGWPWYVSPNDFLTFVLTTRKYNGNRNPAVLK